MKYSMMKFQTRHVHAVRIVAEGAAAVVVAVAASAATPAATASAPERTPVELSERGISGVASAANTLWQCQKKGLPHA